MYHFCTLFNSSYMSRGLAMYESLLRNCPDFILYIFAFDEKSRVVLEKMNLEKAKIISLAEFETKQMLELKKERTPTEYFWTCTSLSIKYVLEHFQTPACTYIDSDVYFYEDPAILLKEIKDNSVFITEHGYYPAKNDQSATAGKYCVQFIAFKNDPDGLAALNWWAQECIKCCSAEMIDGKFGDQKYLDDWTDRFPKVHVMQNLGGGVAPWNVERFTVFSKENKIYLKDTLSRKEFPLIFFHFHGLRFYHMFYDFFLLKFDYFKWTPVVAERYSISNPAKKLIYRPYVHHLETIKKKTTAYDNSFDPHGSKETHGGIKLLWERITNKLKSL